jgi:hypothetical protein
MFGRIKAGDRTVEVLANAATPIRYKQVFHKNLMAFFLGKETEENNAEMVQELAYIMARAAERADMGKLSYEDYIEWLEGFEALAFSNQETASALIDIYQGNQIADSEVKKNPDRQTDR